MAESYRIVVPQAIDQKMTAWPITAEFRDQALGKLRADLGSDPAARLRPVVAPWGQRLNLYSFRLPDPADAQASHVFMFDLIYGTDEATLVVVECGHLVITRPSGGPSLPTN